MSQYQPVTVAEQILADIHTILGEIRDRLPAPPEPAPAAGPVEVREPAKDTAARQTPEAARGRRTTRKPVTGQ